MPDGSVAQDLRLDRCAKAMNSITREWAALEASGPRAGPVREAITRLEPVFHAQIILALQHWTEDHGAPGPATEKLRRLAARITSATLAVDADQVEDMPPHLTAIDFVQLWPQVMKELRAASQT